MMTKTGESERRIRLKLEGKCFNCAAHAPVVPGQTMCKACRDKYRTYYQNNRDRYRANAKAAYLRRVAERICVCCGEQLPEDHDLKQCPACTQRHNPKSLNWHRKHPGRDYSNKLKRVYGISVELFESLLAAQHGRCAICGTGRPGGGHNRWHVDHAHRSGDVRGILCNNCNVGLGYFRDAAELLEAAAKYLRQRSEANYAA